MRKFALQSKLNSTLTSALKPALKPTVAIAALFALSAPAMALEWELDKAHTEIGFDVRHMMVSDVHGSFEKFDGTVVIDDKNPEKGVIDVVIDVGSINTRVEKRDAHLKSPDFFDVAGFPKMTFKSSKIEKGEKAGTYKVTGDLTIRGTKKIVVLDVDVSDAVAGPAEWGGKLSRGFKATTTINRQDYGLKWQTRLANSGVVASDEVRIVIIGEMQPKAKAEKK